MGDTLNEARKIHEQEIEDRENRIAELESNLGVIIVGTIGVFLIPILIGLGIIALDVLWYWLRQNEVARLRNEVFILKQVKL